MTITTDSYLEVKDSDDNVLDRIGLSKILSEYSFEDLIEYGYCTNTDTLVNDIEDGAVSGSQVDAIGFTYFNGGVPCTWSRGSSTYYWVLKTEMTQDAPQNMTDGLFAMVIWLYGTGVTNENPTFAQLSNYKVVTEWDAPHYLLDVSGIGFFSTGNFGATDWNTPKAGEAWSVRGTNHYLTYHTDLTSESDESYNLPNSAGSYIKPYLFFVYKGNYYIKSLLPLTNNDITRWFSPFSSINNNRYSSCSCSYYDYNGANYIGVNNALASLYTDSAMSNIVTMPWEVRIDNYLTYFGYDVKNNPFVYDQGGNGITLTYFRKNANEMKQYIANAGIHFKADKVYKPIINDGHVDGFTDELTTPSELDEWHDSNNHGVTPTPPSPVPSPSGDDYADMSLGVSNLTLGGLTKYAILSKQELINLIIDYNTNQSTAGTNFSNHIICLYRLGFGASDLAVTNSDKIKMIQSAGDVDFESSANYSIVSRQTPFIHFGSITVPRHTGTFYDFSPYSSYELYIPGCGWIPLPDNVAGRTLNVYLVFDLPTCSAKGIVRIEGGVYGGTTIATVNGIIGASVPFTIGENGMQRAAIMSANAQVAAGIATGIVGATINPMLAVAGGAELISGVIGAYTAGNTNYISTKGGAGDFSAFGDGAAAMLKYNAPEIDPVVNNTMFGHTVGYLCNEVGKLSTFSGFTVCDNPHVIFSASSREREEIERLLASGVIL